MNNWSLEDSGKIYSIKKWSCGYFQINTQGKISVSPQKNDVSYQPINILPFLRESIKEKISYPIILKFPEIIKEQINDLASTFKQVMKNNFYNAEYKGVFPIKVNQQKSTIESIVKYGKEHNVGLEAGSKAELMIVLAYSSNPDALIICNGIKDQDYINAAVMASVYKKNIFIVIDRFSELDFIIKAAKKYNVVPNIGFRIKLESKGSGKWIESSGNKSKFGLSAMEIIKGIEKLENSKLISALKLIHFHVGSQITDLSSIHNALIEAGRIYVEVTKHGGNIEFFDVGGGLGLDYDGTASTEENSVSYTFYDYANTVVKNLKEICDKNKLKYPNIITEAGRALVAHHSMLIFDAFDQESEFSISEINNKKSQYIKPLFDINKNINAENLDESLERLMKLKSSMINDFMEDLCTLSEKADFEIISEEIYRKAYTIYLTENLESKYADFLAKYGIQNYYANFSLFQSAPDYWAVNQVFPILPAEYLDKKPTKKIILQDLTCDSDGKINRFVNSKGVKKYLYTHDIKDYKKYLLCMFMIGAYQEILGNLHNLFGRVTTITILYDENKKPYIESINLGEKISDMHSYAGYSDIRNKLLKNLLGKEATKEQFEFFEVFLNSYTYSNFG